VDGNGRPLALISTAASKGERELVPELFKRVCVAIGKCSHKTYAKELHADKGYDSKALRCFLRSKGIRPVIPKRRFKNGKKRPGPKVPPSKYRWKVERCFAWIYKKFRRIAMRWERKERYWNGFLDISIAMIWINEVVCG
jgi:transposase